MVLVLELFKIVKKKPFLLSSYSVDKAERKFC